MAALIEKETGVKPEVIEGSRGEFTVWVDGKRVAEKTGDGFPSDQDALTAVRKAM